MFFQSFWVVKSWDLKEEEFHLTVSKVLRTVATDIAIYNKTELPKTNLIQRRSSNYYSVNVNSAIDANILEDFLYREFNKVSFDTDFEYAVYDCTNDEYQYSNYCSISDKDQATQQATSHPKFNDLIYYFVVTFPDKTSYIINDLRLFILFSLFTILALLSFMYAVWVILRQKQVTDLQKDFINNMTHEFKTPISSIKIASDFLLSQDNITGNERTLKYTSIIKQQNDRLNNQVEKVLNIARLEKDKFRLNLKQLELVSFIAKIVEEEKIKCEDQGGQLTYTPHIDAVHIDADKLHLTNVVTNLLDNAIKYCKDKPNIRINLDVDTKKVILSIKDNGIGISKENVNKIFNKFYRVSTGNRHNVKGFGLGLFYVKNIIEQHHWYIRIESILDQGTHIILHIPKSTITHGN